MGDTEGIRIVFILDETGSMSSIADATIENYNSFINDQQNQAQDDSQIPPKYTLVKFDTTLEIVNFESIEQAEELTYSTFVPSGSTALYDAIGCTLNAYKDETYNILVILTDGEENSSTTFDRNVISAMTREIIRDNNWDVMYLGANQDAFAVGNSIGVSQNVGYTSSHSGVGGAYDQISSHVADSRGA